MKVSLRIFGAALAVALVPALLAWRGHWLAALVAAIAEAAAAAALARGWTVAPLEEVGRGFKRWVYGDLEVPLDPQRMAAWPDLTADFQRAQTEVAQSLAGCRGELAQERARLAAIVGSIPDGLVVMNLRGDILYLNEPALGILGLPFAEARCVGPGIYELLDPQRPRREIQDILKNRAVHDVVERPDPRGLRPSRFYRTKVSIFTLPDGAQFGVALILRDITGERRFDSLKEELLQNVAQQLRAPLFAMQGNLHLLEKSLSAAAGAGRQQGYCDAMTRASESLARYIDDSLDAARIEMGHFELQAAPMDPVRLVRRMADLYRPAAEERAVSLELRLAEDPPGPISADERLLERVLNNLLANAVKFAPRDGRVTLALRRSGSDGVEFSVADTGPGIPPDQRSALFERLRQGGDGRPQGGFSLGLPICLKIVELHRGSLTVRSEAGLGSEFVFRIPVRQDQEG